MATEILICDALSSGHVPLRNISRGLLLKEVTDGFWHQEHYKTSIRHLSNGAVTISVVLENFCGAR